MQSGVCRPLPDSALLIGFRKHYLGRKPQVFDGPSIRLRCTAGADNGSGGQPPKCIPWACCASDGTPPGGDSSFLSLFWAIFLGFVCLAASVGTPAANAETISTTPAEHSVDASQLCLEGPSAGTENDIETLRRLLRDVFMELMVLRKRIDGVDPVRDTAASEITDSVAGALQTQRRLARRAESFGRVSFQHLLETYGRSLDPCGPRVGPAGPGARLQSALLATLNARTHLCAQMTCSLVEGARLWHTHLLRDLRDEVTVMASPLGAKFGDIASDLHAARGQGALAESRRGCPAHAYAHVCGVAARINAGFGSLASGFFLPEQGNAEATTTGVSPSHQRNIDQRHDKVQLTWLSQLTVALTRCFSVALLLRMTPALHTAVPLVPREPLPPSVTALLSSGDVGIAGISMSNYKQGALAALDFGCNICASGYCLFADDARQFGLSLASYPGVDGSSWNASLYGPWGGREPVGAEVGVRKRLEDGLYANLALTFVLHEHKADLGLASKFEFQF